MTALFDGYLMRGAEVVRLRAHVDRLRIASVVGWALAISLALILIIVLVAK